MDLKHLQQPTESFWVVLGPRKPVFSFTLDMVLLR